MADIRVKPTKRTPVWIWLLAALLVVAAVLAYLWFAGVIAPAPRAAAPPAVLTILSL